MAPRPSLSRAERMSYQIGRGETGVLSFEPYKSYLLPFWRFRTPEIASNSSQALWKEFQQFGEIEDFVGMDMSRKFIQMGMTRAKRYANHKGGRKYDKEGEVLPESKTHADKSDKAEASRIFKEVWQQCREDSTYLRLKKEFQDEQKAWRKQPKNQAKS